MEEKSKREVALKKVCATKEGQGREPRPSAASDGSITKALRNSA